jgi:hypothetical protein
MPNDRRDTVLVGRHNSRRPRSAAGRQQIAAVVHSAGETPSPSLLALQAEYAAWSDALPESLRDSTTAGALQEIIDLDLDDLAGIRPPRGFGRD